MKIKTNDATIKFDGDRMYDKEKKNNNVQFCYLTKSKTAVLFCSHAGKKFFQTT